MQPWVPLRRGPAPDGRVWLSAGVVLAIGVTILWGVTANVAACRVVAAGLLLVWLVLKFPLMGRTERLFLLGAVTSTLAAFVAPSPLVTIQAALERAALFLVFVFALGFLREAARTSRAVARCGRFIVARPPGWRYAALTLGGHAFSIVLNIGALSLLGSMVTRADALARSDAASRLDRQRRMGSALFRGFTTIVLWSPVGAGVPITLSLLPRVSWFDLVPWGLGLCLTFLTLGWVLDQLSHPAMADAPKPGADHSVGDVLPMLAITGLILGGVVITDALLAVDLFVAVVGVTPLAGLLWIAGQYRRIGPAGAAVAAVRRAVGYLRDQKPSLRPDGMIVVALAYISVIVATLAQATPLGDAWSTWRVPPLALALAIPAAMALVGQIGVNPLVSAILLCATLGPLDPAPLPPLGLALIVQGGWSIALATTPYSGSGVILARALGTSPHRLARWNLAYGIACYGALALYSAIALA